MNARGWAGLVRRRSAEPTLETCAFAGGPGVQSRGAPHPHAGSGGCGASFTRSLNASLRVAAAGPARPTRARVSNLSRPPNSPNLSNWDDSDAAPRSRRVDERARVGRARPAPLRGADARNLRLRRRARCPIAWGPPSPRRIWRLRRKFHAFAERVAPSRGRRTSPPHPRARRTCRTSGTCRTCRTRRTSLIVDSSPPSQQSEPRALEIVAIEHVVRVERNQAPVRVHDVDAGLLDATARRTRARR